MEYNINDRRKVYTAGVAELERIQELVVNGQARQIPGEKCFIPVLLNYLNQDLSREKRAEIETAENLANLSSLAQSDLDLFLYRLSKPELRSTIRTEIRGITSLVITRFGYL